MKRTLSLARPNARGLVGRHSRSLLVFLLRTLPLAAQDRDALWRQDLQFLATELPARRINFFATLSQADFTAAVNSLN